MLYPNFFAKVMVFIFKIRPGEPNTPFQLLKRRKLRVKKKI